jgi:predicted aspartyl protease
VLPVILLDYGAESVIIGRASARHMGVRPGMMDSGAVALRVADGGTTRAFDRTKNSMQFVFNPKPQDKTKVLSHVIVVDPEDADTLLGMSVLRKISLTTNPYKGRVKYYVN